MISDTFNVHSTAPLFVDGRTLPSKSDETVEVLNPSNGRLCLTIPRGCNADVDMAVESARRAFEDGAWSEAPPSFRKRTLQRLADSILADASVLDALDAGEMGKPVSEARSNAAAAAGLMRFYAEAVDKVTGDVYVSDRNSLVAQRRLPWGVVAALTPWNFPTSNVVRKIAPALAAGNSVVLKPSEISSRSALYIARLALDAGLPAGVLNVVPGLGETVGRALALHMDVDMLTFTGSTAVGRLLLEYAGRSNLKVVMAECGGKSPHVVFDDGIDLNAAADAIARLLVTNQGQICSVGSRLVLPRTLQAPMVERISASVKSVVMGDAMDPKTTFGPLASLKQRDRVLRCIEAARADGVELAVGGRRALQESGGYFVEPTVFCNVPPGARVAQEEVFGPVLSVIPVDSDEEAIRVANGTAYGLAAYVWTTDLSRAMRMAKGIRSSVWINASTAASEHAGHAASFEPVGQSGMGTEGGLAGMESYMYRQTLTFNYASQPVRRSGD